MTLLNLLWLAVLHMSVLRPSVSAARVNSRVHLHRTEATGSSQGQHVALANVTRADPCEGNPTWYWCTNKDEIVHLGLVSADRIQTFELCEDNGGMWENKKYHADSTPQVDENTLEVGEGHLVMTAEFATITMKRRKDISFKDSSGQVIGEYKLFNPNVMGATFTWVITSKDDEWTRLYTIELVKDMYHCDLGVLSCRPVIKIKVGDVPEWEIDDTLIYYAVGEREMDEPEFRFYHDKVTYERHKEWVSHLATYQEDGLWIAKVKHKHYDEDADHDKYDVEVKQGEDAGLILLAGVCMDVISDDINGRFASRWNR